MPTAYAGGIYPFCLSFFFFCLFFFLFTKGIEFDRHELALQNLYFRDYYFIQVSLCQSILWHVYLAYFAYICTSVRQQEILLLFCNYTANSRGIKKRFSYHFNESLYYLRPIRVIVSNLLSLPAGPQTVFLLFTLKFMS